jgi:hypothetical protein
MQYPAKYLLLLSCQLKVQIKELTFSVFAAFSLVLKFDSAVRQFGVSD